MSLAQESCAPVVPRLSPTEVEALLAAVPGWAIEEGQLARHFRFADFHRTMAFVNAVAAIANTQDHHPDLLVSYGACVVRFSTHSVGGLSRNDFICAAQVDTLPT